MQSDYLQHHGVSDASRIEMELQRVKAEAIESGRHMKEQYENAIQAIKDYAYIEANEEV